MKIVGEIIEDLLFKHDIGDRLVGCGVMSHLIIRDYQIWRQYRTLIPKELQEDIEKKNKGSVVKKIMYEFRIKNKKTIYDAINKMESFV